MRIPYYIVDVFAENKYGGNQLAVFIDLENNLTDAQMQAMTREINFAESSFIKKQTGNNKFVVRIFTPEHEVPFAGHPSIGSAYVISQFILKDALPKLILELKHADIAISISNPKNLNDCIISMQQAQPEFREFFSHEEIAKELKIPLRDIDANFPIQEISTGLPYIIVPLKSRKAIENLKFTYTDLQKFLVKRLKYKTNSATGHSTSFFFFTSETYNKKNQFNVRMRLLENDILSEDAATGSANGCFLAYLLKHQPETIAATVEQGFQMGRKSFLYLKGSVSENNYYINVGVKTQLVSEGFWYV